LGFVDLHSHVLSGLDDGAQTGAESEQMLLGLGRLGFTTVCATPHQRHGMFMPSAEAVALALEQARGRLTQASSDIDLQLGAENMWDEVFYERSQKDTIPSYADGPAFLFELNPLEVPPGLAEKLFEFRRRERLPVLAHPERYQPLWGKTDALKTLREQCALVVDLGALVGHHGRGQAKAARHLVSSGLAHAAASDVHRPEDVKSAEKGIDWIRRKEGAAAVDRLLRDGPRAILSGELPA